MADSKPDRKSKRILYQASQQGLDRAEKALQRLCFDSKLNFAKSQLLSRTTVTKFFQCQPIQLDSFRKICHALELNWKEIIKLEEELSLPLQPENYRKPDPDINEQEVKVQTLIREVIVKDITSKKIKLTIVLKGDINSVQDPKILQSILREYSGDSIEIMAIREGSIILTIEGYPEDVVQLISCIESGELTELNGFPIKNIEIMGESLDEEEDNQLDDKWRLVREIVNQGGRGQNLGNTDLSDADLSRADLNCAYLHFADFSDTDLSDADLSNANLSRANVIYADLSYADLSRANVIYADLGYANLNFADLSYADLRRANLSNANLSRANLILSNLSYANLNFADLNFTDLNFANLSYANLKEANLWDADLRCANLINADLRNANVENAKFGNNLGISLEEKTNLIKRGAIFEEDSSGGAIFEEDSSGGAIFEEDSSGGAILEEDFSGGAILEEDFSDKAQIPIHRFPNTNPSLEANN